MASFTEREAPKGYTEPLLPLLGLEKSDASYRHFDDLTPDGLAAILKAAPHLADETQNDSPRMWEFLIIGQKYPDMRFHGYVIGPSRCDERISIEGWCHNATPQICEYYDLSPDEMSPNRAWWD